MTSDLYTHGQRPMSRHGCQECDRLRSHIAEQDRRILRMSQEKIAADDARRARDEELQRHLDYLVETVTMLAEQIGGPQRS